MLIEFGIKFNDVQFEKYLRSGQGGGALNEFRAAIQLLNEGVKAMADKFDVLVEQVAKNTSVTQSAVALIDGLITRLDEAKDDPEQIAAIVADLETQRANLAQAVAQGTPSEPPTPEPVPEPTPEPE